MRSLGPDIGAKNEHRLRAVFTFVEHVEADPVVVLQQFLQAFDDHRHQVFGAFGRGGEIRKFVR